MATDTKLDQKISGWLEAEAPGPLADRVLRATFDRTRTTRQHVGLRAVLGRIDVNRSVFALGGAAVAVIAAVLALNALNPQPGPGGPPSPTPASSGEASTEAPSSAPSSSDGGLPTGPHFLWDADGVRVTVAIPGPGWTGAPGEGIVSNGEPDPPDGAGLITFTGDLFVYGDPCNWESTRPEMPSTNADEFVAAMSAQASRDASEPVDITVGGYSGKSITVHVPDDAVFAECNLGTFGSWGVPGADLSPYRFHQTPGQIDQLFALDVDGVLVVIDTSYYAGTPESVVDELIGIAESATFE